MYTISFKALYLGMNSGKQSSKNVYGTLPGQLKNKISADKLKELANESDKRGLDIYIFPENNKLSYGFKIKGAENFSVKGYPSNGNFMNKFKFFAKDFFGVEI